MNNTTLIIPVKKESARARCSADRESFECKSMDDRVSLKGAVAFGNYEERNSNWDSKYVSGMIRKTTTYEI